MPYHAGEKPVSAVAQAMVMASRRKPSRATSATITLMTGSTTTASRIRERTLLE